MGLLVCLQWLSITICSEVIEHIQNYDIAVNELMRCTRKLYIITTPFGFECNSPEHINHFFDSDIDRIFNSFNYCTQKVYDRPGGNIKYLITVRI